MQRYTGLLWKATLSLISVLFALLVVRGPIIAQAPVQNWEAPINLSRSGATKDPVAVVDANGRIHVIWRDDFADWVYTSGQDAEWSKPVAAEYIFGDRVPRLFADASGNIHAFWIDEEGALFQGWAAASSFGSPVGWSGSQLLAAAAAAYDVAVDAQGNLHLAYVRNLDTADFPAGVYYRNSSTNGASWSNPIQLYRSAYMRVLTEENASLDIAATDVDGVPQVYVAWDNPAQKRVLLIKSSDGGKNWGDIYQVDGPNPATVTTSPFKLKVNAKEREVLLLWNSGLQSGFDCTQYFQSSNDGGETWSERQLMFADYVGCPQDNQFIPGEQDLTLLMTVIRDEVLLSAWNGSRWSLPQPQGALFSFTDPDTFNAVDFRCRQALKSIPDRLSVVGCDLAGGGDIWITSRLLGSTDDWFPPPTAWTRPRTIASGAIKSGFVTVLVDVNGGFHTAWIQLDETAAKYKLFYSRLEEEGWSEGIAVVNSPVGEVEAPSLAIDPDNRLFVVWRDSQSGEIYFSWANAGRAISPFEWTAPRGLPMPQSIGSAPDILVQPDGSLLVAYAVPVNEGRGIYLTRSDDHGETWSNPAQIFDAAASGWVMVDNPRLVRSTDGALHLLWTRSQLGERNRPVALYYSSSATDGQSWSEPELVVEQPVEWLEIESAGQLGIHRMWISGEENRTSIWHQISLDEGATWTQPANLTRFGETPQAASLVRAADSQLHLLQAVIDLNGRVFLDHSIWSGESWVPEQGLTVSSQGGKQALLLGAGISPNGRLAVAFGLREQKDHQNQDSLLISERQLFDIGVIVPQPSSETPSALALATQPAPETLQVTPMPEKMATTAPPAEASPTRSASVTPTLQTAPISLSNRLSAQAIGALLALLVVGMTAGLALVIVRRAARGK